MSAWRKASACGASNTCVEVAWRAACSNEANCVQVGHRAGAVLVRDSAAPDAPALAITPAAFAALLADLKEER